MIKKLGASFVAGAFLFCAFNCNAAKQTIITKGIRFIVLILSIYIGLNQIKIKKVSMVRM
jgi:hypothetical protein